MSKVGYQFNLYAKDYDKLSGVLAVSKHPIQSLPEFGPTSFPNRWLHFTTGAAGIEFLGIYLNGSLGPPETLEQKQAFWDHISISADKLLQRHAVILGDLNTGLHRVDEEQATFRCAPSFKGLTDSGWTDAFRHLHGDQRAYSWWSTRRGFRLDHAFVTPTLAAAVKSAEYIARTPSHVLAHEGPRPWPKDLGPALSDHAALVIEINA